MWLAHYTDILITINKEDYQAAQKFKLRNNGKVYYVPGVGIDISVINNAEPKREEIIESISADNDSILMISVGDLNKNKNNEVIIRSLAKLKNNKIHYLVCGIGDKKEYLEALVNKYNLEKNIHLLGYRSDIPQLLKSCDLFIMMSRREGLSRSIMEAMAAGLPCIVSNIRGNTDLIKNKKGGFLIEPDDVDELSKAINILTENISLRNEMQKYNLESSKIYDAENIKSIIKEIYSGELKC
jgi:glycosyltransferase involved in cell wall biosynthesis